LPAGREVAVEQSVPSHLLSGLAARGHGLTLHYQGGAFGKGQIIRRLANGTYVAAASRARTAARWGSRRSRQSWVVSREIRAGESYPVCG
jgi:hypothetical protein